MSKKFLPCEHPICKKTLKYGHRIGKPCPQPQNASSLQKTNLITNGIQNSFEKVPNPFENWKSKPPTPSVLARKIAVDQEWGDIDSQTSYGSGVVNFSASGHGGVVVVPGIADVDAKWLSAARKAGVTDDYYIVSDGRKTKTIGPAKYYDKDQLQNWFQGSRNNGYDTAKVEVIVGEEDCDWAVAIAACGEKHRQKWHESYQSHFSPMSDDYVHEKVKEYYPEILEEVYGVNHPQELSLSNLSNLLKTVEAIPVNEESSYDESTGEYDEESWIYRREEFYHLIEDLRFNEFDIQRLKEIQEGITSYNPFFEKDMEVFVEQGFSRSEAINEMCYQVGHDSGVENIEETIQAISSELENGLKLAEEILREEENRRKALLN